MRPRSSRWRPWRAADVDDPPWRYQPSAWSRVPFRRMLVVGTIVLLAIAAIT